jgi:hypothetical protein
MWTRGQRWWVSYADQTCVTVAKVGQKMDSEEHGEWASVIQQFVAATNARAEFSDDRVELGLRFPFQRERAPETTSAEVVDVVKEAATPATPASMNVLPSQAAVHAPGSAVYSKTLQETPVDAAATTLRSVTIMTIMESTTPDLFACEAKEDVLVMSGTDGECEAKAIMVVSGPADGEPRQIEFTVLSHFGMCESASPPTCDWDGADAESCLRHIVSNFDALRTICSPPCWPLHDWRSPQPLHVGAVLMLRSLIGAFSGPLGRKLTAS